MAASAVGPPSGAAAAAILSASLGYAHYDVTHSAKVANIPSSQFAARPGGGRSLRGPRPDPQTDERSRTRLFKADEAFHERDVTVLSTKRGFADYLDAVDEVTQGDVIPYHMPDTVVPGVNDDAAIVIDLINRAGGRIPVAEYPCSVASVLSRFFVSHRCRLSLSSIIYV